MSRLTFKKEERLTNKKTFESLFGAGKSIAASPFRLVWIKTKSTSAFPVQLGISVPKKSFKKSTDRNTLKRRIRESYRKNKYLVYEELRKRNLCIALIVIYIAKEELPYKEIERKMIVSLHKLLTQVVHM